MEQCRVLEMTKRDLELRSYPLPSSTAANSHSSSSSIVVLLVDGRFYELQAVELQQQGPAGRGRYYGSWFIDQRVCSSGTIYLASIFDPRFLLLPFLELQGASRYSPLDQIVTMPPQFARLSLDDQTVRGWHLEEICDVNDKLGDDMLLYRHNEGKVKQWLAKKAHSIVPTLAKQRMQQSGQSSSSNSFNGSFQRNQSGISAASKSETTTTAQQQDLVAAADIVADYLSPASRDLLWAALGLTTAAAAAAMEGSSLTQQQQLGGAEKRKKDWEMELELEKESLAYSSMGTQHTIGTGSSKTSSATYATALASNKASKVNQVASKGTKNISSFFAKAPK